MFANITRTTLCLTALSVATLWAAPLDATKTESFDWDWKFARFGKMPDGSTLNEPGAVTGFATASSQEGHNPADNAVDGDDSTRWCAANASSGQQLTIDMGRPVEARGIHILWEKQANHLFKVEGSADGKKWITIADKIAGKNNSAEDTVNNKAGKPRYFRVTVVGTGGSNWASIREFTVKNAAGSRIAPKHPANSTAEKAPSHPDFDDSDWRSLNLPHDWGIEGPFSMDIENRTARLPWVGIGWYRKDLTIPADAKGNKFYLDFDGVMSNPTVYVNGEKAGEYKYGYGAFRIDITPFLKYGQENSIAVRVNNPPSTSRWYPGGGIHRHVWLTESNPVHIAHWGVFVKTPQITKSAATVEVDTTVDNTTNKPVSPVVTEEILKDGKVVASVTSKGKPIAAGAQGMVRSSLRLNAPTLWTLENPHLYVMRTTVKLGDKVTDVKTTNFGVRTVEWKPTGFYLNGKRIQIKGVCQHHDLGPLGGAAHTRGYERQIEILKSFGVNSIRCTHNPPAPEVLDLCDKMGILAIDELYDVWHVSKEGVAYAGFDKWHEKDVVNFCRRDRNHPSVIIWSTGNEVPEQGMKNLHHISKELTDLFHREDPTRLVTNGCNNEGAARNGFADTFDVYGYNYKPWAYKGFAKDRPHQPFYASETSSALSTRGEYFFPVSKQKNGGNYLYQVSSYDYGAVPWGCVPDVEFKAQEECPNCAGEYVWTGFDYMGEPTPYNLDATNALNVPPGPDREKLMAELKKLGNKAPSRSSYFGIVDLCGFKKDRYYLYQSHWMPEKKMAHILPHWNWPDNVGQNVPVTAYSAGDEAELFLNGKSLGVRKKGTGEWDRYRFVWDEVTYEPGELKVVVKKGGKEWATKTVCTTGAATAVTAEPDRKAIKGDGYDLSYVTIAVCDDQGRMVPRSKNELTFTVSGPADIAGICNGDPTDFTTMANPDKKKTLKLKAFNGLAQVILRSRKGESGKVTLKVTAQGLKTATAEVTVK